MTTQSKELWKSLKNNMGAVKELTHEEDNDTAFVSFLRLLKIRKIVTLSENNIISKESAVRRIRLML